MIQGRICRCYQIEMKGELEAMVLWGAVRAIWCQGPRALHLLSVFLASKAVSMAM